MALLLERTLNGQNCVSLLSEDIEDSLGVKLFTTFLEECRQTVTHELAREIGQVLKVPVEDIVSLQDGYITEDAANNLREYFKNRLSRDHLEFLQRQSGKAGLKNSEDPAELD